MADEPEQALARKASFLRTMRTVAWSFFGVRKSVDHERDSGQLDPVHVVIAAVIGAALLIAVLLLVVNWVTAGPNVVGALR